MHKRNDMRDMPVVSSQYWNIVYGQTPGQAALDEEGMQTLRTLGKNMAWMLKHLNAADAFLSIILSHMGMSLFFILVLMPVTK